MGLNKSIIGRKMEGTDAEEEEIVLTYFSAQKFVLSEKDYRLSDSGNLKRKLWNLNWQ
jgi:hypothetical protein